MVKAHDEINDFLIENDLLSKLSEITCNGGYNITNYAVTCEDKLVCFTGSDIIDADNIRIKLAKMFPGKIFEITDEFLRI